MFVIKRALVGFFVLFLFFGCGEIFAKSARVKNDKKKPINITSERVEIFRDENLIIFIDKVKAAQDNFTLYADKMIVKYRENPNKKMEIVNIKTEKNVKFINEDIVATGNEGFYDVAKNLITLKNNVTATESGIVVFADEFQYNIITGKTNIIGSKKDGTTTERVTIILDSVDSIKK